MNIMNAPFNQDSEAYNGIENENDGVWCALSFFSHIFTATFADHIANK